MGNVEGWAAEYSAEESAVHGAARKHMEQPAAHGNHSKPLDFHHFLFNGRFDPGPRAREPFVAIPGGAVGRTAHRNRGRRGTARTLFTNSRRNIADGFIRILDARIPP